jgi:hypothetical protein
MVTGRCGMPTLLTTPTVERMNPLARSRLQHANLDGLRGSLANLVVDRPKVACRRSNRTDLQV